MQKMKFKLVVAVMLTALFVALFAISVSAEVVVNNGVVTGLNPNENYQYAQVTIVDYTTPSYTSVASGATKIEGLTAGIWYILNTSTSERTAVWIPGEAKDRNDIGTMIVDGDGYPVVKSHRDLTGAWSSGEWTGHGSAYSNKGNNSAYYLTGRGEEDVGLPSLNSYIDGDLTRNDIVKLMEASFFKYAYTSEEIIPVEELYTISFATGVRQGSLTYSYVDSAPDKVLKTKFILYTMDKSGKVTPHEALVPTVYGKRYVHAISIEENFPKADGWVVGIEVHPYGEVPVTGISFDKVPNSAGNYVNTIFSVEYIPTGYNTATKRGNIRIPAQYNGANTSYIEGYGNGIFNPNGNITKAETATLLARLMNPGEEIPSIYTSKFADCTVNDWFYNAISYVETLSGFDHIKGARLNPNKAITRGEFAQIVFALSNAIIVEESSFKDVDSDNEYFEAICSLADIGVINGYADGTFRPDATITRAEAVTVLNRIINLVADENTVVKSSVKNTFSDVDGHWAEYQILMAANDNVKSKHHLEASAAELFDNGTTIEFETAHVKIAVNKKGGKVASVINKYDETDISASTTTPWFAYITANSGANFYPSILEIEDNRLAITFSNKSKAYFIIDVQNDYFTLELDSALPLTAKSITFGNLSVNTEFSSDPDSYRLSAVSMNANTDMVNRPGGSALKTTGYAMRKFNPMGAKLGITFSRYGGETGDDHRIFLKKITDAIDPTVGTRSFHGGAYSYDNADVYYDYIISSTLPAITSADDPSLNVDLNNYMEMLSKHGIDQIYAHTSSSGTFVQGDFNFISARTTAEKNAGVFGTAEMFKERISDVANSYGIQMGLHTYSSLVDVKATTILADPKWQKQIAYRESENLTLSQSIDASATEFIIKDDEDASSIKLTGTNADGTPSASALPYRGPDTSYFLIDEEIVLVKQVAKTGLYEITRGQCGTEAVAHDAGAEIRHLLGHYSKFQPIPGSDLFYHVADLIAEAYNEGGFDIVYLDAFESFAREPFCSSDERWYYYSSFVQRIVSGCDTSPLMAGSSFEANFWNARSRAGAIDHGRRGHKEFNYYHMISNLKFHDNYLSTTLGWFHFAPDFDVEHKNAQNKTMFTDDLDLMGTMGIAFDMGITANGFTYANYTNQSHLSNNTMYHSLYSRLRKAGYFSDTVKKTLQDGILNGKEYKIEYKESDKTWAFREMTYAMHTVFDLADTAYATGKGNNPYSAQVPYIRIEQRYSTLGNEADAVPVLAFDENTDINTLAGKHEFSAIDLSKHKAFKVKVKGNSNPDDGILLMFGTNAAVKSYIYFFLPTNHEGWREFILIDADQGEYEGYEFEGDSITSDDGAVFRANFPFAYTNSITMALCGDCEGVMIDDITAYPMVDTPVSQIKLTVNGSTVTFDTRWDESKWSIIGIHDYKYMGSGDYIEYIPSLGKAYLHYYKDTYSGSTWKSSTAHVREISVSGTVPTVPAGDFTYTYSATATDGTTAPLRAKVVVGLQSDDLIENEAGWVTPTVEAPDGLTLQELQHITLTINE
ncbi:MAG: S-layer homology domain-containing protein [Clostridia bacterium]|nr:S-layer homology domain-containing protein [Clostridia bacterium]